MSKRFIGKKRSRRTTFGFVSSSATIDVGSVSKALIKPTQEIIDKINREGPTIVRAAMREALTKDPQLSAYARFITADNFPGEKRSIGTAKAGSGVNISIQNRKFVIRIQMFEPKSMQLFGRDGFFKFRTLSIGREGFWFFPNNARNVYVVRVNDKTPAGGGEDDFYGDGKRRYQATGDNKYQNKVESSRRDNTIVFRHQRGGLGPVVVPDIAAPSNPWTEEAAQIAEKMALKKFRKI